MSAPKWWRAFVDEMRAIGCLNVRREAGDFCFDCPPDRLNDAKRIVAKYSVK